MYSKVPYLSGVGYQVGKVWFAGGRLIFMGTGYYYCWDLGPWYAIGHSDLSP